MNNIVNFSHSKIEKLEHALDYTDNYLLENAPELAVNNVPAELDDNEAMQWLLEHMLALTNNVESLPDDTFIARDISNIYADCSQFNRRSLSILHPYFSNTPSSKLDFCDVTYEPINYNNELVEWCQQFKDVLHRALQYLKDKEYPALYEAAADLNILTTNVLIFRYRQ